MPTKKKSDTSLNNPNKESKKRFVVEEKTDITDEKPLPTEEKTPTITSEVKENKLGEIPSEKPEENKDTEVSATKNNEGLKKEETKDTIPSSNITSFSLLDADKGKKGKEIDMSDIDKPKEETAVPAVPQQETATKSSQEEVNKWIENYDEKATVEKKKGPGFFKILLIILIILSVIAVIVGGVFYYQKNISNSKNEESPETVQENPTTAPTATPTEAVEKVDYSKYTLQILNGSGIPGEAAKAQEMLTDLDFEDVTTGNASNYDFENSVIALKEGVPDQVFTDIKDLLNSTYNVEDTKETLDDSSTYDVVVTIGQRK